MGGVNRSATSDWLLLRIVRGAFRLQHYDAV